MNRLVIRYFLNMILAAAAAGMTGLVAQASDVSSYFVRKGHLYEQTSAAAPVEAPFLKYAFHAAVLGDPNAITNVEGTAPAPTSFPLVFNQEDAGYVLIQPADSLATLNLLYGSGNYSITIDSEHDGSHSVQLNLGGPVFPTAIPHISNFAEAQTINPDEDFTLTWDAFAGAGQNDYVELEIQDSGSVIFTAKTTGNSATIPAGTLGTDSSYDVVLRFVQETVRDATSYPGATGSAGFYNETHLSISTGTGDGGGPDTQVPVLFLTSPMNGAANVGVNTAISFTFSEPMADKHSIEWSANVNPSGFTYSWSANGQVLTALYGIALPANATITWKLNPTVNAPDNFRDVAGNILPPNIFQGSFTTGNGTVDPCNNQPDLTRGFAAINKTVNYLQTNNAAPVLDAQNKAGLTATFRGPSTITTTGVTLTGPGGINKPLDGQFGFFTLSEDFDTPAQLDTAYPSGDYTFTATTSSGTKTMVLTGGSTTGIPVPQLLNLEAMFALNISNDFTLQFSSFAGAGQNDSIFIQITDTNGSVFFAPDPCRDRNLSVSDTSIVIPAGTFKSGGKYQGSITFTHGTDMDTNSIANSTGTAGVSVITSFAVSPGVAVAAPTWRKPVKNPDGSIDFVLEGQNGNRFVIEGAAQLGSWSPVSTNDIVSGVVTIKLTPGTTPTKYLRAKSL